MDPLTIIAFLRTHWKLFLIGALVVAVGYSRLQLANSRADFAEYKAVASKAARIQQVKFITVARKADIIYIEAAPKIITETKIITEWITRNVENVANCPTPNIIRVYNASITGVGLPETTSP